MSFFIASGYPSDYYRRPIFALHDTGSPIINLSLVTLVRDPDLTDEKRRIAKQPRSVRLA